MKPISLKEIQDLFKDTEFELSLNTYNDSQYCYIRLGDETLCALRGNISKCQVFDRISFTGFNRKTEIVKDDTKQDCRYAFSKLPEQKRDKIFDILGLALLSEYEMKIYHQKQSEEQVLYDMLSVVPQYQIFDINKKVFAVSMREELVLNTIDFPEFIGTYGLGPCIGVAIIARQNNKVSQVGVAHIDALTDLKSLGKLVLALGTADTLDIVMLSSENKRWHAVEILKNILKYVGQDKKIHVRCELNGPQSFAVNTLTGEIYRDIPMKSFVQKKMTAEEDKSMGMRLLMPGVLRASPLYDVETRKIAVCPIQNDALGGPKRFDNERF